MPRNQNRLRWHVLIERFDGTKNLLVLRQPGLTLDPTGGCIAQRYLTCFSPGSPVFNSQRSQKNFRRKIIDVAEVNQWPWLEESGQWLKMFIEPTWLVASQYYKKHLTRHPSLPSGRFLIGILLEQIKKFFLSRSLVQPCDWQDNHYIIKSWVWFFFPPNLFHDNLTLEFVSESVY